MGQGSSPCFDAFLAVTFCSRGQISGGLRYKEQAPLISDPNLFLSHADLVYVLWLLRSADASVVGGQESGARAVLCV